MTVRAATLRELEIVGLAALASAGATAGRALLRAPFADETEAAVYWVFLTILLAAVLFGLNGFFRLFGAERSLVRIGVGVCLLLLEAAFVSRPLIESGVAYAAQSLIFILLAIIAVLPYRAARSSPGAVAGGTILLLAVFGFLQRGLVDPGFATLVVTADLLQRSVPGAELVGPFAGAVVPLLVLWGFLTGEIVVRNKDWGRFYADAYRPTVRLAFLVSQALTIGYVLARLAAGRRASPFVEGDALYLLFAFVTAILMGAYSIHRARAEGLTVTAPRILKRSFVVVGTVFLIPALYPALDPLTRGTAVAAFLYVRTVRNFARRRAGSPDKRPVNPKSP